MYHLFSVTIKLWSFSFEFGPVLIFSFFSKEKERQKIEQDYGGQIWEKQQKLNMLRNIVNEGDSDAMPAPQETFRTPAPKTRTHTTPGKLLSARSENDMRKIGNTPTPRSRTATTGTSLSAARANLKPTPRSTSTTPKPVGGPSLVMN